MGELLDSVGIRVNWSGLPSTPRYVRLRDDLNSMCCLRRWLSFRMRREFERVSFLNMQELLNATLEAGDRAISG